MKAWLAWATLLLLVPAASAQAVQPMIGVGKNAHDTSFGTIVLAPRPAYEAPSTEFEARIGLREDPRIAEAAHMMIGLNALSERAQVQIDSLQTADGRDVVLVQDNRSDSPRQPRVWVEPWAVWGEELVLRGTVRIATNGQFHVGVLVIAFDAAWAKAVTSRNEVAELYGFSIFASRNVPDPVGGPIEGKGNVPAPGLGVAATCLAVALFGFRRRL